MNTTRRDRPDAGGNHDQGREDETTMNQTNTTIAALRDHVAKRESRITALVGQVVRGGVGLDYLLPELGTLGINSATFLELVDRHIADQPVPTPAEERQAAISRLSNDVAKYGHEAAAARQFADQQGIPSIKATATHAADELDRRLATARAELAGLQAA